MGETARPEGRVIDDVLLYVEQRRVEIYQGTKAVAVML